ncbi:MAG TPA: ABC transporter substrate-binding protein [Stellaceae bacterium]|nr:ABC transporter substrate-binding protein [Stellaceae bacterium]
MQTLKILGLSLAIAGLAAGPALADIKIGLTLSTTGPAASLGIPQKNTVALLPTEIAGQKIQYIVLDDGGDPTKSVTNVRKLITEDNVDAVIGSSTTPASISIIDVVAENKVPMVALAATASLILPMDEKKAWVFKAPQNDILMATALADFMAAKGLKTIGFIGFSDAYGDGWYTEAQKAFTAKGLKIVANERYNRPDTSVTGQVLKVMQANPDAVLIAGAGTPAALPAKTLKERGYKGPIYQTHGAANSDFLRVGGKDVEGTIMPAGPVLVAAELPDGNPIKKIALDYVTRYEAMYGVGSVATFGAHALDADRLILAAVPAALETAKPGTAEFRKALRDAMEKTTNLIVSHGIMNMTPTDHNGFDDRARVMVTVENNHWKLLQ